MLKKNNNIQDKLAAKKAKVLKENKKHLSAPAIVICCVLIIASAIFIIAGRSGKSEAPAATAALAGSQGNSQETVFIYPASLFEDRKVKYFKYEKDNLVINYFILKSSDGVIRAAFDACDVCWRAGKGYSQDSDDMVCRNCCGDNGSFAET